MGVPRKSRPRALDEMWDAAMKEFYSETAQGRSAITDSESSPNPQGDDIPRGPDDFIPIDELLDRLDLNEDD